jgi:hypothetical protein
LLAADQAYQAIDGRHLKQHVNDLAAISRRYRDLGHQFWGRIIGTQADADTAQWMGDKLRAAGVLDVRTQPFELPPQWLPGGWAVTASGGAKTLMLESAQPAYQSVGTPERGLDLEAVYVGTGTEADFIGRDIRRKAAIVFSSPLPGSWSHSAMVYDSIRRAEQHGAAAVFTIIALPGNIKQQFYPTGTKVPTFSLGLQDGESLRELIEKSIGGSPVRMNVQLDVKMVPQLQTSNVWGVLPGMTDEQIVIVAHRDGWFEGGTDNASGLATAVGLAEYFAKVPKERRRRTIVVIGTPGHHNSAITGVQWLADHKDTALKKTALIINCEHTAATQNYLLGPNVRPANTATAMWWYVGGGSRLAAIAVNAYDTFGVATFAQPETAAAGEIGPIYKLAPSVQLIQSDMFFHSDAETPDTVPSAGLEATTRAYAKIIDEVNKLELKDLLAVAAGSGQ